MHWHEDPLMPGRLRFPVVAAKLEHSVEMPTAHRPFVMRGAVVVTPKEVKHRTPSHQTRIAQQTTLDNRVEDDSYTVPDD
jgi:hypothetical protein